MTAPVWLPSDGACGWITAEWHIIENNRRARLYRLTRVGQRHVDEEQEKWNRLSKAVGKVLRFA